MSRASTTCHRYPAVNTTTTPPPPSSSSRRHHPRHTIIVTITSSDRSPPPPPHHRHLQSTTRVHVVLISTRKGCIWFCGLSSHRMRLVVDRNSQRVRLAVISTERVRLDLSSANRICHMGVFGLAESAQGSANRATTSILAPSVGPTLRTLPKSRMTKQGNFTQRTPQAKKQSDQASRQISKQASGKRQCAISIGLHSDGTAPGGQQTTSQSQT
ncbi:hypothetical protein Tco_0040303 [Tanacetum coccineum]